jgi:6-pyruvoyltetrahydropterin 2'-reductase
LSLPVDEIFGDTIVNGTIRGTLQGEGLRMGVPSIFIRTGGCNLTCSGFGCAMTSPLDNETVIKGCDSIHAVNAKHFKHTWTYYDRPMDLIHDIRKVLPDANTIESGNAEKPIIIFTGGEPLLHHKDEVLISTIEYFVSRGYKIFFETNGTIAIDFNRYDVYKQVSFSMSVKMSASGEEKHKRWKPEVVNDYLKYTTNSYFKFVLSADSIKNESDEIFEFLETVPTFGVVYVMPKGETALEVESNAKAVYEFAVKHSLRYSDRLHIRVFDDLRGV